MSTTAHPAAELFPMMAESELRDLADDIKANGLLEPIILHDGKILDGRNRLAACRLAGVEPQFQNPDSPLTFSPVFYVLSKNLHRRHLTIGQRAAIAAETVPLLAEEAKKRMEATQAKPGERVGSRVCPNEHSLETNDLVGSTRDIAAKQLGVSSTSVQRAMIAKRDNPEAYEKVKRGELSVNAAATGYGAVRRDYVHVPKEERVRQIAELASKGYHDTQIAEELGVSARHVQNLAGETGIALPHNLIGKRRPIDANRVMEETVISAQGLASTLDLLQDRTEALNRGQIPEWIDALRGASATINRLIRLLKGLTLTNDNSGKDSKEVQQANQ